MLFEIRVSHELLIEKFVVILMLVKSLTENNLKRNIILSRMFTITNTLHGKLCGHCSLTGEHMTCKPFSSKCQN